MTPYLREVADGVHAYVQPDGGWCVSNAAVLTGGGTVLIDTAATEARARGLRTAVEALTPEPVRLLVNTHHHGDHTFGNGLFPEATIVAHELARAEMAAKGGALRAVWPQVDWGDVPPALPDVTFADRLTLRLADRTVELLHVGPAHTTNDVVAWLPDSRVLVAGDVVLSGCTPFVLMGSLDGSLAAVRRLRSLEPAVVVCGHGPVCGPEVFDVAEDYLLWVRELATKGIEAGLAPLELARESGPGRFGDLRDPERLVANLHRAYQEAGGGPPGAYLPSAPVFAEMVALNGGPLTCRA
ncbi:MBL fold metallo-hydrolase [Nonomuraea sp. NPDC050451]|uniref:MBL fold metallo-hydrolase n=1 Tax=Nonomuraea sp. NPDC050451 TaxID=3364364 RepID=UPI00378F0750